MRRVIELEEKLKTLNIPLAYKFFKKAQSLPFIVYYIPKERNFAADGENYHNMKSITIELYTEKKDLELEERVDSTLSSYIWEKEEIYNRDESCYMIVYTMEV